MLDKPINGNLNVHLLFETLGKVLSESTGAKITFTVSVKTKDDAAQEERSKC